MNQIAPASVAVLACPPSCTPCADHRFPTQPDVLALPQIVTFTGSDEQIATLKQAGAGAGVVPWAYYYERMEEDWFHRLARPPHRMKTAIPPPVPPATDATWAMHERAVALADQSKA